MFQLKDLVTVKSAETNQQKDIVSEYRRLCSRLEQERDQQMQLVAQLQAQIGQDPNASNCSSESCANPPSTSSLSSSQSTAVAANDAFQLEQELALTKLRLVEEQSKNQQLEHDLAEVKQILANQNAASKGPWLVRQTQNLLSRNSYNTPNE